MYSCSISEMFFLCSSSSQVVLSEQEERVREAGQVAEVPEVKAGGGLGGDTLAVLERAGTAGGATLWTGRKA